MIKIIVSNDRYACYGHSNEVICAAVSATAQCAYVGLIKYCLNIKHKIYNGRFFAKFKKTVAADVIITTMVAGLQNLAEQYPNEILVVDHRKA